MVHLITYPTYTKELHKRYQQLQKEQEKQQQQQTEYPTQYFKSVRYQDFTFEDCLNELEGLPFWIADKQEHIKRYWQSKDNNESKIQRDRCCFNHYVGLPKKKGKELPIFDYELLFIDPLLTGEIDNIAIKKARGLGVSEIILRLIAYEICCTNRLDNTRVFIIAGNRQKVAEYQLNRLKSIFHSLGFFFSGSRNETRIKNVTIQVFPSNHVDAARGYAGVSFIFIDELDFFQIGQQMLVRSVIEGYIGKENVRIVGVSTPNEPYGLLWQIEHEDRSLSNYSFLELHWTVGQNKIYDQEDIDKAKRSQSFEREFGLRYGIGTGDIFTTDEINQAIALAKDPMYHLVMQYPFSPKSVAIDIGNYTSKTIVTMMEQIGEVTRVTDVREYDKNTFVDSVTKEIGGYLLDNNFTLDSRNRVYIDASRFDFIAMLKRNINEDPDWHRIADWCKANKQPIEAHMVVVPISFGSENEKMTLHAQNFMKRKRVAIDARFNHLLQDLMMAKTKRNISKVTVEKESVEGKTMDYFDSFILGMRHFV